MAINENIVALRKARGWSRPYLASLIGTSYQQIERLEKGQRQMTEAWLAKLAGAFEVSPATLVHDPAIEPTPVANAKTFQMEGASAKRMERDVPIYGTALGADEIVDGEAVEQTTLNKADVIGYLRRPVLLDGRADVYGLYVQGNSMAPRHRDGARVFVEHKRRPSVGEDAVVYLRVPDAEDGELASSVLIKTVVRKTASYIELEQYTPALTFKIEMSRVMRIDRVIPWEELID